MPPPEGASRTRSGTPPARSAPSLDCCCLCALPWGASDRAVAHYIRNAIRARSATAREDWRLDGGHTLHRVRGVKRTETAGRTGILRRYFPRHASPRRCRAVAHRARGRSADRSRGHRAGTSAERLLHLARPEEPGDASGLRRGVSRVMREAQVYERTDPRGEHRTLMEF